MDLCFGIREGGKCFLFLSILLHSWFGMVCSFGQTQDIEFTFLLQAGTTECFFQTAKHNGTMEVEFQVRASLRLGAGRGSGSGAGRGSGSGSGAGRGSPAGMHMYRYFRAMRGRPFSCLAATRHPVRPSIHPLCYICLFS